MIRRFCLYSVIKNLRFSAPFLVLYFLHLGLSYLEIGQLLGCQHLATAICETPSGVLADRWGRRSTLALAFVFHALALAMFGWAASMLQAPPLLWFYLCAICFGLGEALRSGCHKAIMLDYLDHTGQSDRITEVVALARSYSNFSAGAASLAGGLALAFLQSYALLFWLSAAAAAAGVALMMSYPQSLEGEASRRRMRSGPALGPEAGKWNFFEWFNHPGFARLFLQSIVFESQLKIVLKYYVQPFLNVGLQAVGISLIAANGAEGAARSSGAVWIGLNECVRDTLGGFGAKASNAWERWFHNRARALNAIYVLAAAATVAIGVCAWGLPAMLLPGLLAVILLTVLQNMRRPVFVAALNQVMDKPHRATTLSVESQARSLSEAAALPLVGWAADIWGLSAVFLTAATLLLLGLMVRPLETPQVNDSPL